jgi:hypothetical protein
MKNDRDVNQHLVIKYTFDFNIFFLFYNFIALQIISQAPRQSLPLFKPSNIDPGLFFSRLKF